MKIAKNKDKVVIVERDNGEATLITLYGSAYPSMYPIEEMVAKFPEEGWTVVYEDPEPAPPLPNKGDYISATLRDGMTLEGRVDKVHDSGEYHDIVVGGDAAFIGGSEDPWDIVSWELVQKPWAVGDVVPAGTVVGKEWLGRTSIGDLFAFRSNRSSAVDRTIVWLGE